MKVLAFLIGFSVLGDSLPLYSRRQAVGSTAALMTTAGCPSQPAIEESFRSYQVIPDTSPALDPSLVSISNQQLIQRLARNPGALWLGEHHNSPKDHALQEQLVRQLYQKRRPLAIGLEQVQIQFQSVLDDYTANKITTQDLQRLTEWETRWQWPFAVYQSLFETARELHIPLVALNVNSEDLLLVEEGGLPNLPPTKLSQYIGDPYGFADFAKPVSFKTYVDYVIFPSYDLHKAMGLLDYSISGQKLSRSMSFRNFFSCRILWDEAMANRAQQWTQQNPNGLLIGLVGADHVKFRQGIPGRYARLAKRSCTSVLLNPTLIDTRPSGSVAIMDNSLATTDHITLQLRYVKEDVAVAGASNSKMQTSATGGVMPLADYLLVST